MGQNLKIFEDLVLPSLKASPASKKKKPRVYFFRSKFKFHKPDGSELKFTSNNCVVLKKRLSPRGKVSKGPVIYNTKRRKFLLSFNCVL